MISYSRIKKGDELEICGAGAPGYGVAGERVTVVHVYLDSVVVSNPVGRWAKFVGTTGASRLRVVALQRPALLCPEVLESLRREIGAAVAARPRAGGSP
jgi:hypothetical protein